MSETEERRSQAPSMGPGGKSSPPQYKRSMKNYLIDARFQFKYTGMLVSCAVLVSLFLGVFLARTTDALVLESGGVMEQSALVVEKSKSASLAIRMCMAANPDYAALQSAYDKKSGATDKGIEERAADMQENTRQIIKGQKALLVKVTAGLVGLVLLIFMMGIYVTHKIAGPVYKMTLLFKVVGDGKLNLPGRLRKGDELQAFFESFSRMVDKLRVKKKADVERLEQAIEQLRASGASEAALANVVALRDDMKRSTDS